MVVLRHEDRGAIAVIAIAKAPAHRKPLGHFTDGGLQAASIGVELRHVELDALEELPGHRVGVLVGVENIRTVSVQDLSKRRDESPSVGAADEECSGFFQGLVFSRSRGARPAALRISG